jgi:hypothetical protein
MRTLAELESIFDEPLSNVDSSAAAERLLRASEEALEHWVSARGDPSFNACRETCREIAYHYNLVTMQPKHADITDRLGMMALVSKHLYLFISGKLQVAGLGEFCCSSKPIRAAQETDTTSQKEA